MILFIKLILLFICMFLIFLLVVLNLETELATSSQKSLCTSFLKAFFIVAKFLCYFLRAYTLQFTCFL